MSVTMAARPGKVTQRYQLDSAPGQLTPEERAVRGKAARAEVPLESHAEFDPPPDRPDPISLLEAQAKTRLPDLVPAADLPAASALNGIEFNLARAVGPGAAGALIAAAGVGAAFSVNAVSFAGVILVIALWRHRLTPLHLLQVPRQPQGAPLAALVRQLHRPPALRA